LAAALLACLGTAAQAQVVLTAAGNPIVGIAATVGSPTSTLGNNSGTGGANSWPAAEDPTKAINTIIAGGDKYLNFAKTGVGFIVTPTASSILNSFRFATGNDAPERDPLTVSIEGTNSANATTTLNSTWALLYNSVSGLATDPGRNTFAGVVNFTNTQPFSSYRVLVQTVRDSTTANSFQFAEMELRGVVAVPEPSTVLLCGVGLAGAAVTRWRRRSPAAT